MPAVMNEAPERIWLIENNDPDATAETEILWSSVPSDAENDLNVEYVSANLLATRVKEARAEAFKEAVEIAQRHREHSGYTLHRRGLEALDCRNVIWRELEDAAALERAAATDNKEKNNADR